MIGPSLLLTALLTATSTPSIAAMRWEKRVLLVSVSRASDTRVRDQLRILDRWRAGAADRDLAVVTIVGDRVAGASDTADALRRRYKMPSVDFAVVLVGKDGETKLRRSRPISAAALAETIDAMPMRREGGR